jgi:hypothetical protein
MFPNDTSQTVRNRVMDAAAVLEVAVSTRSDAHFTAAANLLEEHVVAAGEGVRAIEAPQRAFQGQAVTGRGSGIDEWLTMLAESGIVVFADADGPAGPRRQAERIALAAYRARLGRCANKLGYSLLADDLPPMTVPDLVRSFRAAPRGGEGAVTDEDRLDIARRWDRMVLSGLPGTGKSTALEQLAALWSDDADAPVPVVVSLQEVARRVQRASDVTLPLLVEVATIGSPADETRALCRVLEETGKSGNAMLLCDGLDEARELRGVVTDGLLRVSDDLPAGTGLIIASRPRALSAAQKLRFPEAELVEPSG